MNIQDQTCLNFLLSDIDGMKHDSEITSPYNTRNCINLDYSEYFGLIPITEVNKEYFIGRVLHYYQQCGYSTIHQHMLNPQTFIFIATKEIERLRVKVAWKLGRIIVDSGHIQARK